MLRNLCERCSQPETQWRDGVKTEYRAHHQAKAAFRANSKARHEVESFTCSICTQRLINNKKEGENGKSISTV